MIFTRKKIALAALGLALAGLAVYLLAAWPDFSGGVRALDIDLARPDALIRSCSLSSLPPDLLRVPLAKDVLTEDFVDYYEHNEARESLMGTLKRLAYEHRLSLPEQVLATVFDEPAEVALWRDKGGRLRYFALSMRRGTLAKVLGLLLPLTDRQVASAGKLPGTDVPVLLLEYGYRHQLALIFQGDRIVALSDPGMLMQDDGALSPPAAKVIEKLLEEDAKLSPFARHFGLERAPEPKTHEIILGASAFAWGYEHFAPALAALSFTFDDQGGWHSAARLDRNAAPGRAGELWAAVPYGPGLCSAVPVDWRRLRPLLRNFNDQTLEDMLPPELLQSFGGAAAACWYGDARYYAPLLVASLTAAPDAAQAKKIFALAEEAIRSTKNDAKFDEASGAGLWRGTIKSSYELSPALAISGKKLLFSPDARLVEKAVDVAAGRYPAAAAGFADNADATLAVIDPAALAALLRQEIYASLPRSEARDFRNAAEYYLEPRLEALAAYPAQRIMTPAAPNAAADSGSPEKPGEAATARPPKYEWLPLTWETLKKKY